MRRVQASAAVAFALALFWAHFLWPWSYPPEDPREFPLAGWLMVAFSVSLGFGFLVAPRVARWVALAFAAVFIGVLWVAMPMTVGIDISSCTNRVGLCVFEFGGVLVLPLLLIGATARPFSLASAP